MALTYSSYVGALQQLTVSNPLDQNFYAILPSAIDFAEQRIYRELDLLSTVTVDTSVTLAAGVRDVAIPQTFIVTNGFNVITPAGSAADNGTRSPLTPTSRNALDILYPGVTTTGQPEFYAMTDQWTVTFGPAPDGDYVLETIGTVRPPPLSETNTSTFLTDYLPDLFIAASMVFMSLYQRNFDAAGTATGNTPGMGGNWEQQYQAHFASANVEEMRKKGAANGWTSYNPAPLAKTPR